MRKTEILQQWINESSRIVAFVGAGCSTESGIPDFRSVDGLYHQTYDYPPETILSHTFFERHTEEFYRFYRDKLIVKDAKPNAAHLRLAYKFGRGRSAHSAHCRAASAEAAFHFVCQSVVRPVSVRHVVLPPFP